MNKDSEQGSVKESELVKALCSQRNIKKMGLLNKMLSMGALVLLGATCFTLAGPNAKANDLSASLESGITSESNLENRICLGAKINGPNLGFDYSGTQMFSNLEDYSGQNDFTVGGYDGVRTLLRIKTNEYGVSSTLIGVRLNLIDGVTIKSIANNDTIDTSAFFSSDFSDTVSGSLFQKVAVSSGSTPGYYTEAQITQKLKGGNSVYVRTETNDFNFEDTTFVLGIAIDF